MECMNIWGQHHSHFGMWQSPDNNLLKKWVLDVIAGAEKAFTACGIAMHLSNSCCKIFTNISQILIFQYPQKGTDQSDHNQVHLIVSTCTDISF